MEPAAPAFRCLPQTMHTRLGEPLRLELLDEGLGGALERMYLDFQPRNCFQGLPPIKDEVCVEWVRGMIRDGWNVVAVAADRTIVGHVALFPINPRKCELLVVVSPSHQNVGVGTRLVACCAEMAAERGFERIWLPVESTNTRAKHVYKKCGFEYVSARQLREVDMVLDLPKAPADADRSMTLEGPHALPRKLHVAARAVPRSGRDD